MLPWKENELLRRALSLYAGERVLDKVLREGAAALVPAADSIELTLLFLDVARVKTPQEDVDSAQLGVVTHTVSACGGTFDTFIGEAASAWWGANGELDHPLRACLCAKSC